MLVGEVLPRLVLSPRMHSSQHLAPLVKKASQGVAIFVALAFISGCTRPSSSPQSSSSSSCSLILSSLFVAHWMKRSSVFSMVPPRRRDKKFVFRHGVLTYRLSWCKMQQPAAACSPPSTDACWCFLVPVVGQQTTASK
jgi:hypothetical protein